MAIVEMSKMYIVAHRTERNKILRTFMKSGYVQTEKTEEIENNSYKIDDSQKDYLNSKLIRVNFALNFLKEIAKEINNLDKKSEKLELKKENMLVALEDYETLGKEDYDLFAKVHEIEDINKNIQELKSEKSRIFSQIEQLKIYQNLEIKFSEIKDTKNTSMFVGTMPSKKASFFEEKYGDRIFYKSYPDEKLTLAVIICHKELTEEIKSFLVTSDYNSCTFDYSFTAKERIVELDYRLEQIEKERLK